MRSSFCDIYPPLRVPVLSDTTGCIELCLGEKWTTARMLPADARRVAHEILRRIDEIENSLDTRPPGGPDPAALGTSSKEIGT